MVKRYRIATAFSASLAASQTVSLQGTVLSVSGAPIAGATCRFKNIANKTVTDAQGNFDFSHAVAAGQMAAGVHSLTFAARRRRSNCICCALNGEPGSLA